MLFNHCFKTKSLSKHSNTSLLRSCLKAKENVHILLSVEKTAKASVLKMCQRTAKASQRKQEIMELGHGLR